MQYRRDDSQRRRLGRHRGAQGCRVSLLNAVLMYFVASRIWTPITMRLMAASLMLLSPAALYYSRVAPRSLFPVPFILAWLWCVAEAQSRRQPRLLLLGAFVLGIGCYSYTTAIVLMPVYLLVTLGLAFDHRPKNRLPAAIVLAFLLPTSFGIFWVATHRSVYTEHINRYRIYDASRLNALQGLKDFANYNNIQERVSIYWDYFDPRYLFFTGGAEMSLARPAGVLPMACALWVPIGLYRLSKRRTAFDLVLLAGFVTAPMAAILVDERYIARRGLAVIPFAVLAASVGADHLLSSGNRFWRLVTIGLFVSAGIQGLAVVLQR
jgi:hypothetical protein